MIQELIYMSAPHGLVPGRTGFCTVAMTEELPNSWRERLESISSYDRHTGFGANDPRQPVVFSHRYVNYKHVLSRIAPVAHEYTNRTNHIAHHLLLDDADLAASGPAAMLGQDGMFLSDWTREPEWLSPDRLSKAHPKRGAEVKPCRAWEACMGDAGWAGYLAESFVSDPEQTAILIYDPGVDVLSLIREALQFVERPWDVKFTTYYTSSQSGQECVWRGVLRGSEAERDLSRRGNILKIDLGKRAMVQKSSTFIEAARRAEKVSAKRSHTPTPAKQKELIHPRQPIAAEEDNFESYAAEEIGRSPERRASAGREPPPLPQHPAGRRTSPILFVVPLLTLCAGVLGMWALLNPKLEKVRDELEIANKELENVRKDVTDAKKSISDTKKDLTDAQKDLKDTKKDLTDSREALKLKEGELQTEKKKRGNFDSIKRMISNGFLDLSKLDDVLKRNESLAKELAKLKGDADSIKDEIKKIEQHLKPNPNKKPENVKDFQALFAKVTESIEKINKILAKDKH